MTRAVLLNPPTRPTRAWECTACNTFQVVPVPREALTPDGQVLPHTRFHACAAKGGVTYPMTEVGARVEVREVERGDYEGDDHGRTTLVNGRPLQAVEVWREDGVDCAVYAPFVEQEDRG